MLENKTLLITGGTGSFGNAVLNRFLNSEVKEIRIFSRDEKKQDDMRKKYNDARIKFYIGDVRNEHSVNNAIRGVDYIFHAAALKQVPSCEFFPMEAVKTNVNGTENVLNSAINHGVKCIGSIAMPGQTSVYNIGSQNGFTIREILDKVNNITKTELQIVPKSSRNIDCHYNVLNIEKVGQELDWRPEVGIEDGLHKVWEWIKNEQQ